MCRGIFYEIFDKTAGLELLFPDGGGLGADRCGEFCLYAGEYPAVGGH